jgi:hypothetical protein
MKKKHKTEHMKNDSKKDYSPKCHICLAGCRIEGWDKCWDICSCPCHCHECLDGEEYCFEKDCEHCSVKEAECLECSMIGRKKCSTHCFDPTKENIPCDDCGYNTKPCGTHFYCPNCYPEK